MKTTRKKELNTKIDSYFFLEFSVFNGFALNKKHYPNTNSNNNTRWHLIRGNSLCGKKITNFIKLEWFSEHEKIMSILYFPN